MAYTFTELNPGAGGDKLRVDDLGGGIYLAVSKPVWGTTGQAKDVDFASPMPVHSYPASTKIVLPDGTVTDVLNAQFNFAAMAIGDNSIIAADAAKKIRVLALYMVAAGDFLGRWKQTSGSNFTGHLPYGAKVAHILPFNAHGWWTTTAVNEAILLNSDAAVNNGGTITYCKV